MWFQIISNWYTKYYILLYKVELQLYLSVYKVL